MPTLTHSELHRRLQAPACVAIGIDYDTDLDEKGKGHMAKGGRGDTPLNPFWGEGVVKHSTVAGLVGAKYANVVGNQLGREGKDIDFEPQERKWGYRVGNLVAHKGQWYVELKVQSAQSPTFDINGTPLSDSDVASLKPFLKKVKAAKTQDGLEKKVIWRDIRFSSLRRVRIDGTEFDVVADTMPVPPPPPVYPAVEMDADTPATADAPTPA